MNRTWKPVAAGIIDIVSGVFSLLAGIAVLGAGGRPAAGAFASYVMYSLGHAGPPTAAAVSTTILVLGMALMVPGALSVVGGILALRRRWWPVALAGSISTLLPSNPLGIPAVVLVALSRREFTQTKPDPHHHIPGTPLGHRSRGTAAHSPASPTLPVLH